MACGHFLRSIEMSILDYNRKPSREKLLRGEPVYWIDNNPRASYIRQCVLSFPPWVDRKALLEVERECRRLERCTGIKHTIGHIVPLNHPYVCGLTVPWNIEPQPALCNLSKGNEWHPDQYEIPLFLRTNYNLPKGRQIPLPLEFKEYVKLQEISV